MKNYNQISKKIDLLVSKSKFYSNKKQALDSIVEQLYNLTFSSLLQKNCRQFSFVEVLKKPSRNFSYDVENEELLTSIINDVLNLYVESEPFTDILTILYADCLKYELGQHMTPEDLSDLLSELIDNTEQQLDENNTISFYDPACGTGALALGKLRYIYKKYGKETVERHDIFLCDIDEKMCIAAAVNLELNCLTHNINYNQITIYNSNSLLLDFNNIKEDDIFLVLIPNFLKHRKVRKLEKQKKVA